MPTQESPRVKITVIDRKSGLSSTRTIRHKLGAERVRDMIDKGKLPRLTIRIMQDGVSYNTTRRGASPAALLGEILGKIGGGE